MDLNKRKFDAVVVVEGKDDTMRLKQVFPGIETIETNGSAVQAEVLAEIKRLSKSRRIIIFTDPDFNGERIRRIVTRAVPAAQQAFITREEGRPQKKGASLGVEHASKAALIRALKNLHQSGSVDTKVGLTRRQYNSLGFSGRVQSRKLREDVGKLLGVGYGNASAFYHRLVTFGIDFAQLQKSVREVKHE